MRKYEYEGEIVLGQQEGGHAAPAIDLVSGTSKCDLSGWLPYECSYDSLDLVLEEMGVADGYGPEPHTTRVRITVEILA